MLSDPVNSKETQEIVFSRKKSVIWNYYGTNYFNNDGTKIMEIMEIIQKLWN